MPGGLWSGLVSGVRLVMCLVLSGVIHTVFGLVSDPVTGLFLCLELNYILAVFQDPGHHSGDCTATGAIIKTPFGRGVL